jgi:para-nitrobenzyl esterase
VAPENDMQQRGSAIAASLAQNAPVVETTNGKVRGAVHNGICVFRGVRYADSMAGANRFLPPQQAKPWAGVQDALSWSASAPQLSAPENTDPFYAWYSAIQPVSEDCLFLNVFTPGVGNARRPVMFWIHGGGWREFSGTAPGFDGTQLARAQDIVVVTVNHRLNAFGYLRLEGSHERFADSGNAGLLDLVMALTWVRDNAVAFGGDPGNVTIFGESGGASKIAAMLSMRAAHGLFHKAILQSSAGGMRLASPEEAARQSARLAKALDVARLDGDALQRVSMPALLAALETTTGAFRGMIDGRSFDSDPFGDSAPALSAGVPVLAGCTNTESTYYMRADPRNFALALADVQRRLQRFLQIDGARVDTLIDAYRAAYPDYRPSDILIMITSDYIFKRNTYGMAALQAASARAPVYAYLFSRETPIEGGRVRSPHTTEVPFVFGTTTAAQAHVGTGSDIQPMTERMMATWASFARSGDPNNPLVPAWTPFTDGNRQTMVLDVASRLAADPGGEARAGLEGLPYFGYGHSIQAFVTD